MFIVIGVCGLVLAMAISRTFNRGAAPIWVKILFLASLATLLYGFYWAIWGPIDFGKLASGLGVS